MTNTGDLKKQRRDLNTDPSPTVHMIGNAHLDLVWLWRWTEGLQEVKATFMSAAERIDEYPGFVFTSASALYYKFVEENSPELFQRIKAHVEAGRWNIVGGWWLQPDCNLPGGESFVRQGLYGQSYFREKFGRLSRVGYNVDSFGHNIDLPQILKKSAMDYYVFMRPKDYEKELPGAFFRWQGRDGSEVTAFRIPPGYNQDTDWGEGLRGKIEGVTRLAAQSGCDMMCFYGVGNHGGGPTKENIELINQFIDNGQYQIRFASPEEFFLSLSQVEKERLPLVTEDLQYHAVGCYSAHSEIKMNNRQAENRIIKAEKLALLAYLLCGQSYPAAKIKEAWQGIMFNQFHDILGGCSIKRAYDDARNLHGQSLNLADEIINHSLQRISWDIDTRGDGLPVIVFNPHPWLVKTAVEINRPAAGVRDSRDQSRPFQLVKGDTLAPFFTCKTLIPVKLPPFGYQLFRLEGNQHKMHSERIKIDINRETGDNHTLENEFLRVVLDEKTGAIRELYDKEEQVQVLKGLAARPLVMEDYSDTWSHGVSKYSGAESFFQLTGMQKIEDGPVRSRIRVKGSYNQRTEWQQDYLLYQGSRSLECRVKLNWQEQHKLLKMLFPLKLEQTVVNYETAFSYMEGRDDGRERPMQRWVDLTGLVQKYCQNNQNKQDNKESQTTEYGLAVINDGKYSFDLQDNTIRITCLRSPVYAHHGPEQPSLNDNYDYLDQGEQNFSFLIFPHQGKWPSTELVRKAWEFNQLPELIIESYHQGQLSVEKGFLSVEAENIIVSVIKKAEVDYPGNIDSSSNNEQEDDFKGQDDSLRFVIRGYETAGVRTVSFINLHLIDQQIAVDFQPYEIKTLMIIIENGLVQEVNEVNLLEEELDR